MRPESYSCVLLRPRSREPGRARPLDRARRCAETGQRVPPETVQREPGGVWEEPRTNRLCNAEPQTEVDRDFETGREMDRERAAEREGREETERWTHS